MIEEYKLPSWLSKELDSFGISPYKTLQDNNQTVVEPHQIPIRNFNGRYFKDGEEIPF